MHESKFQVWHSVMQQRSIFVILLAFKVSLLFLFFGKRGDWVTLWFAQKGRILNKRTGIKCFHHVLLHSRWWNCRWGFLHWVVTSSSCYWFVILSSVYIYICVLPGWHWKWKYQWLQGSLTIYMISHKSHTSYLDHMIQHLVMESSSKLFLSCDHSSVFFVLLLLRCSIL